MQPWVLRPTKLLIAPLTTAWLRVNVRSETGISGYMTATMSFGRSWFCTNRINGSRTLIEFARRTW